MVYALVLAAAVAGAVLTLLLQLLVLSRRPAAPPAPCAPPGRAQADGSLRDYLLGAAGGGAESCHFLNAVFLFLFRELRDTALLRRWLLRKIRVELEELLLSRTAGRLLEGLSLRELSLGEAVPVLRGVRLLSPAPADSADPLPAELSFELELEYGGGFCLAIDAELLFGKSASLCVRLSRVQGRLRLVFSRLPFTHWSFCFLEEPLIDFQVQSQFEGRPMPQLTSIIVTQLKRVIKRKHTLPNYKIRYKPFFPVQPPGEEAEDGPLSLQELGLSEGRLKVTVLESSRLLIFGSYDQETSIHCTLELSSAPWREKSRTSIKTVELIKGTSQNIGLIMVQARDGDTGHVCVETVTPNSPAAGADLKRGDRLIAIGGIKVTSSVQASKLIKQAGERVLLFYERPTGQNQYGAGPQDGLGALEDSPFPQAFEDDPASLLVEAENKELDSEFEDLASEVKPPGESRDDIYLPPAQSPKRLVGHVPTKSLGSISPVLSRKPNPHSCPAPSKPPAKAGKSPEPQEPPPASRAAYKPPVPPRPQVKLTLTPCETPVDEAAPDRAPPPPPNGEKPDAAEEAPPKPVTLKPDPAKASEGPGSTEEPPAWESPEALYRNRQCRWSRAAAVFEVESHHRYLNVALWCRDSVKPGSLCCVGHVSVRLEDVALECLATASLEHLARFRLNPPEPRATVSRTALRTLSVHKGFSEKLCYGDVSLSFKYVMEGESDAPGPSLPDPACTEEPPTDHAPLAPPQNPSEPKHNFQDTQFQNSTLCDHCRRKVWTKAASQCILCGYVCHKKCQERCLAENPYCASPDRRADAEAKSLGNRTAGLTRHIINTSSRLLNLRQAPKVRPPDSEPVEQTPNTSDNESSDTEPGGGRAGTPGRLVRREGGLDDSVFVAVKEIGRDLYRGLPTDERIQKLEFMLDKLQSEIDQELEHNTALAQEERLSADSRRKALLAAALAKSGERLQALTLLMIHYRAGIEDIEALESSSLARRAPKEEEEEEEAGVEAADNEEEEEEPPEESVAPEESPE